MSGYSKEFKPSCNTSDTTKNSSIDSKLSNSVYSSDNGSFSPLPCANLAEVSQDSKKKAFNTQTSQHNAKLSFNSSEEEQRCDKRANFEFPDGGWECAKCQNYNFKGRKACYRCKKPKTAEDVDGKPDHMVNGLTKQKKSRKTNSNGQNEGYEYGLDNRVNKFRGNFNKERAGDWTCQRCSNHNFSFRDVCNMCELSLAENTQM